MMSKGSRLRDKRYVESFLRSRFRNYQGGPGMNLPDHVCVFDQEAKSTEACKLCRAWWEPVGDGTWAKVNRAQRRERWRQVRKAWKQNATEEN